MQKLPHAFNKEQLTQLFRAIDEPSLMTACLIGLFCGLRNGEVCRLRVQDIDLSTRRVRVNNGKNPNRTIEGYGKDRVVAIPNCLLDTLKKYLQTLGPDATYLFPSIRMPNMHMHPNDLSRRFLEAMQRAGLHILQKIDTKGHKRCVYRFHTLRHTYATMLWEKIGDILTIKHALGHAKLETTLIYTHVTNKVIEEKINSAFSGKSEISLTTQDPMALLMRRLANGEIDVPTYQRLRNALREKQSMEYIG